MSISFAEKNERIELRTVGSNGLPTVTIRARENDIIKVTCSFDIWNYACNYGIRDKSIEGKIEKLTKRTDNIFQAGQPNWKNVTRIDLFKCISAEGVFEFSAHFKKIGDSPMIERFIILAENIGS